MFSTVFNIKRRNNLGWEVIFIILSYSKIHENHIVQAERSIKAKTILERLDLTVDPCENFYEYVCGNFEKNKLLNTASHIDQFSIISGRITEQMIKIVSQDSDPLEPETFQLIKTYYRSCMNNVSIENRGLQPLQDVLNTLGGWPVLLGSSWNEDKFNWEETDITLKSLGYNPKYLFHIDVKKDVYNTSKNIIYVGASETQIKDLRHDDNLIEAYKDYMINIAELLGADKDNAIMELNETFEFELNLWNISNYAEYKKPESLLDCVSIADLQNMYPYMQWLEYLNNMTSPNFILHETDSVYIENPVYLHGFQDLLTNTSKRVIANYMIWRAIDESAEYLNEQIRNIKMSFIKTCTGTTQVKSRDTKCLQMMISKNDALLPGISAMYVNKYFRNGTREKVAKIVSEVKEYYNDILRQSWLNETTKSRAIRKNELMKTIVGFPDELLNISLIDDYYKDMHLDIDNYFKNFMKLRIFHYEKTISYLKNSPDDTFWLDVAVAADVEVHYNTLHNAMVLPASILQYPIYDEDQPNYMNYGSMGYFIGHEITHAFTFGEFPLDEYGGLTTWWTDDDQNQYGKRSRCFLTQYKNFTDETCYQVPGSLSIGENIADTEGMKIGFNVYKAWKRKNGKEEPLPFANYTDEQLYWISAANTLCTRSTAERQKFLLFTDEHASEELRVNGVMSNSADFAQAFACPVGSRMNPEEKCSFW